LLIIYGGSDDNRIINKHLAFYTHLECLDLITLTWLKVGLYGNEMTPCTSHVSAFKGSKLIIFGGLNSKGYINGEIKYIEFNS